MFFFNQTVTAQAFPGAVTQHDRRFKSQRIDERNGITRKTIHLAYLTVLTFSRLLFGARVNAEKRTAATLLMNTPAA